MSTREAGAGEGVVLIMCCWCTVLAAGLIAPVLPAMRSAFAMTPQIDLLIGALAAAPALMVAVLALPIGSISDRVSPRAMLLGGLATYGAAGMLPSVLDSLWAIIVSRAVAGVGEGATMIASTALIARRFEGARRQRWLALQVLAANVLGIFVVLLGGRLGLAGWRVPFTGYAFGLAMLVPVIAFVRDPSNRSMGDAPGRDRKAPLPSAQVAGFCLLNLIVTVAIFSIILQLPFLLTERGARNSFEIGLGIAAGALGLAAGAALSASLARNGWRGRALTGLVVTASGFIVIAEARGLAGTGSGALIAGAGAGLALPALLAAFVAAVPAASVGRAVGYWTVANFAGQFAAAPAVLALAKIDGRSTAYALLGALCLVSALAIGFRRGGVSRVL